MRVSHCCVLLLSALGAVGVVAQEEKIKRSDLPSAVERTAAPQSQGPTIRGFSQEAERGQIYYEAELLVDGHSKDVLMGSDGAIVEVEE
jgi:hypothetical protein